MAVRAGPGIKSTALGDWELSADLVDGDSVSVFGAQCDSIRISALGLIIAGNSIMMSRRRGWRVWVVLGALVLSLGTFSCPAILLGDEEPKVPAAEPQSEDAANKEEIRDYYELFKLFADTLDQVERNYVKEVDRRKLVEAAIRGMLSELDQYSSYIPPAQLDRFRTGVEAEFGGVGIQVTVEDGRLRVISPIVGSPAYRSGMMAGDVIVEIDGKTAEGITIDEAVERMKGKPGTEVTVKVLHPGSEEPDSLILKREIIRVDTVMADTRSEDASWKWMLDDERKIGYIRVTAFGRHTAEELHDALEALSKQGIRALVLDLRFNPGGLLTSAIEVSDLFITDGRIVSTEGRNTPTRTWDAKKQGTYNGFPIAVLVNRFSASASEIVAACLQDHKRAVVIGERTWGKGSVQNVVELEEGASALKLTTADYHRPSGKNIHRFPDSSDNDDWGVLPDEGYEVKLSTEELGELVANRRQKDIVRRPGDEPAEATESAEPDSSESPPEAESKPFVDRQLDKALAYLTEKLDPPVNEEMTAEKNAAETAAAELENPDASADNRDDL